MEKKVWFARFACAVALGLLCCGVHGGVVDLNVPTDYSSGGFYRYCPATLVEGGVRHVFYCKNTTANQIVDSIYHATVDAAGNLSGESAVLDPADSTGTAWDSYHVCDPSVIKGAFVYNNHTYTYLMAYLGVQGRVGDTESDGYRGINNKVGLAVSDSLDSGWVRMGTDAVVVTEHTDWWGVGQPSLVSLDNAGKVALFYAGDYETRMLALDFTDAAKTTASLTQKVGSEGSPVSTDGVSDLAGTTTKMTITNADFAYNPSTGRLYMIADTPDKANSWYDDGGQNLYITKAVTVYGCTLYALNANSVKNAIWHQKMRIQPADLNNSTLATSARVTNSGLVRTPYGDIAEKTAMVTVANVVPNALYTYRFMPVDWSVKEATDDPYIQSVRLNTYINTGYYPNPTTRVELDYALVEPGDDAETSQARIMDNGGTSSTLPMTFYIAGQPGSGSLSASFFFGDHTSGWEGTLTTKQGTSTARKNYLDEVRRTAIIDNPNKTVALAQNGTRIWECTRDYTFNNTSKFPLGLCAAIGNQYGTSADHKCKMRVYGLKIYESDKLVHDFVPYLQAGWPGLRDTKTGRFVSDDRVDAFAPAYGGNIESGDDPFIASAGHSVVNTRYFPQPKTKIEVDFALAEDNGQGTAILSEIASGKPSVHLYVQNSAEKYLAIGFGDSWNVHNDIRFTSGVRRRKAIIDGPNGTLAIITGATTNKIKTGVADIERTGPYPVGMFACITNAASDRYSMESKSKIYSCRIWIDGTLAHDYKPCVKGGVAGFKDLVDGAFVMSEAKTEDERLSYGGDVIVEPDDGYLEASGINQVIDTGYKCTTKTRIEADFALTTIKSKGEKVDGKTLPNNTALFGVWNDKVNFGFYNNSAHTHSWMGQTNTTDWTDTRFKDSLARRTVIFDGPAAKRMLITEGFTNKVASMEWGGDFRNQYSLPIFTLRSANTIRSDFYPFVKLYGFRIYEDGVLQKNLVPCVKSGIPGLRDAVSGDFLTSAADAYRLTAGGNIEQIDGEEGAYIESDGTQAISTDYRMKNTTRVEADFRLLRDQWNGSVAFGADGRGENRVLGGYVNSDYKHKLLLGLFGSAKWAVQNVGSNALQRHTEVIDAPNKQFYLISGSTTNTFAIPNNYSSATTAADPLALFGCITNNITYRRTSARIYAFRIYEDGKLKHHFLPYWNGEEAGFYDVADPTDPVKLKFGSGGHPLKIGGCGWGEENAAFYTAPHNTNLHEGQTATLEAFAPGAIAYQWYCDGEPIEGATGQTLDVAWRKTKVPAVYTVRATFSRFGVPFTRDASATVTSRPKGLVLTLR